MIDTPTLISVLALLISGMIGYLNWRNGRLKPQVDAFGMAKDAQTVAQNALDGQVALSNELADLKKQLNGQYEIRTVVRLYPKAEILETSIRRMPVPRRKTVSAPVDGG